MKIDKGHVAVVTGAAAGLGKGIATMFLRRGGNVVIADIDHAAAEQTAAALSAEFTDAKVVAVHTDVSSAASVEAAAKEVFGHFDTINFLCNNAGISSAGYIWETPLADWERVWAVNLMGAVHTLRAFVPRMIEAGEPGHVTNIASMGGVIAVPMKAPYVAAKHALVGVSKNLRAELSGAGASIGVSVVCPGPIATDIIEKQIARYVAEDADEESMAALEQLKRVVAAGMPVERAGDVILDAVEDDRFWVFPNPMHYLDTFDADIAEVQRDGSYDRAV